MNLNPTWVQKNTFYPSILGLSFVPFTIVRQAIPDATNAKTFTLGRSQDLQGFGLQAMLSY